MITVFNRKEVAATFSDNTQAEIRQILGVCGIEYSWKIINHTPARGMAGRGIAIHGKRPCEYVIYVARKDYEKALHVLNTYKKQEGSR